MMNATHEDASILHAVCDFDIVAVSKSMSI